MSNTDLGIEENSMKIIESEIGIHGYTKAQWNIVRRVIHATADFDFAKPDKNELSFQPMQLKTLLVRSNKDAILLLMLIWFCRE